MGEEASGGVRLGGLPRGGWGGAHARWGLAVALGAACLLAAPVQPARSAGHAATPAGEPTRGAVEIAGLRLRVPPRAEVTERALPGGEHVEARVVAVTRDDEVLLLTVYRGRRPPKPAKALATHLEELDRALGKVAVPGSLRGRAQRVRLMGRWARGHALTFRKRVAGREVSWEAGLAAARRGSVTVVAAWMAPRGPGRFAPLTVKTASLLP